MKEEGGRIKETSSPHARPLSQRARGEKTALTLAPGGKGIRDWRLGIRTPQDPGPRPPETDSRGDAGTQRKRGTALTLTLSQRALVSTHLINPGKTRTSGSPWFEHAFARTAGFPAFSAKKAVLALSTLSFVGSSGRSCVDTNAQRARGEKTARTRLHRSGYCQPQDATT